MTRRDFLKAGAAAGIVAGGGLGAFYFGYEKAHRPSRSASACIGTGDEGSVLLGAHQSRNSSRSRAIADIRPYNQHRAFHGDYSSEAALKVRPGLMAKYGWKTEDEARQHVKVYGRLPRADRETQERRDRGGDHRPALAPARPGGHRRHEAGMHVITEKLMAHTVHECKEMARVAKRHGHPPGHGPPAALQHPL